MSDKRTDHGIAGVELEGLLRLQQRLRHDLNELRPLRKIAVDEARSLEELQRDLEGQIGRAQEAAVVCIVGSTGAGKSTLLNALVGRDVAIEGVDRPTTSAPVIYRPVDADVSELVRGLPGDAPRIVDYGGEAAPRGAHGEFWRGQILIDAPDVNSVETVHRDLVGELARRSDVLLVTAHRQSIAELSAASFVDLFAGRRGMLFALGRADELTEGARGELLQQLRELAADRWQSPDAVVTAISALQAKADPAAGGLSELKRHLSEIVSEERLGGIRRRSAIGNVARIGGLMGAVQGELATPFHELKTGLEGGANRWVGELVCAVDERLELRRSDLCRMLWDDAAKVWDGPGGYALKVGGLSALGLGAGAAVARRNPVLAAGLAVGSVAADRVRGAVREGRFESTSGLLPGSSEVEGVGRSAFAEARIAAREVFVDSEADAMAPDSEELEGHAVRAVDEAWDRLLRVDLPRAARRGVPRWIRWAVDIPVLGLGGFVLFRVVAGFASERYVGVDFLLSALIIALAWLFTARLLVRRRLGALGSSLLRGVRSDVEQRIGRAAEAATAGRLGRLEGLRGRLDRVGELDKVWRAELFGEE